MRIKRTTGLLITAGIGLLVSWILFFLREGSQNGQTFEARQPAAADSPQSLARLDDRRDPSSLGSPSSAASTLPQGPQMAQDLREEIAQAKNKRREQHQHLVEKLKPLLQEQLALRNGAVLYSPLRQVWARRVRDDSKLPSTAEVLETRPDFVIYRDPESTSNSATLISNNGPLPVLYNPEAERFAIVTGLINARFKDVSTVAQVARSFNLEINARFDEIRLALLQVPAGQDLREALAKLRQDPRVDHADLDLIEALPRRIR